MKAESKTIPLEKKISLLLSAAREFYEISEAVSDQKCKVALIYLVATALQRVKVESEAKSSDGIVFNNNSFDIKSNRHVYDGRLTISSARKEIRGVKDVRLGFGYDVLRRVFVSVMSSDKESY
jgi:hypothetical protein